VSASRFFSMLILIAVTSSPAFSVSTPEQKQRALGLLEQAVKTDPRNPELWIHLGFAYRKEGRMDKAQQAFEQARTIDPSSREALYMLGLIYEKQNLRAQAQSTWNQYIQVETDPIKKAEGQKHLDVLKQ
jgi:cytochrome c-type biogenesis protein CcmH/NrfG